MLRYNEAMTNPIIYVILNGSLNMSPGKAAAQTAHAVMMLGESHGEKFTSEFRRTVIVLAASGREQMDGICDYLYSTNLNYEYYIDEGANEVEAFSMTAIAVEPIASDDLKSREIFADLPLYGGTTDHESAALYHLQKVAYGMMGYDGIDIVDDVPRYMKKTIRKLGGEI